MLSRLVALESRKTPPKPAALSLASGIEKGALVAEVKRDVIDNARRDFPFLEHAR